ncbi:MAG: helix-turn-helix transcriptional regulator [Elusimicrobia bacterium]|nr:helix-turn-helix transcriptional regulator [Elusimicrobiota bacterium]
MNRSAEQVFGRLVRSKREALQLSQMDLSKRVRWPQAKVSRVEQGKRSVTLSELLVLSRAFGCSGYELFSELESGSAVKREPPTEQPTLSPGFYAASTNEDVLVAQLARFGVRFLGRGSRPALVALPADETVLAALRFMSDPRVFEALPALLLNHASEVDWTKLGSAAYSLGLQNRLGMVLAVMLKLKDSARDVDPMVWNTVQNLHDSLAEKKFDREEVVGTRPKTDTALNFLRGRTPAWLRFWHGLASADMDSFKRHLPR